MDTTHAATTYQATCRPIASRAPSYRLSRDRAATATSAIAVSLTAQDFSTIRMALACQSDATNAAAMDLEVPEERERLLARSRRMETLLHLLDELI